MEKLKEKPITESSWVQLSLAKFISLIVVIFVCGGSIVKYQSVIDNKIEKLQQANEQSTAAIMQKLNDIDRRTDIYALKKGVEDALVYMNRQQYPTNYMDEMILRTQLRDFLNKN